MTYMIKTQIYLPEKELLQLQQLAKQVRRSLADLVREAIRRTWLTETTPGPVALWSEPTPHTAVDHDSIYDE